MKKISEFFSDVKIGGTPSRGNTEYFQGKNLWVSIKDLNNQKLITSTAERITDEGVENSNCKLVKKGSLLFSFKLTVGKVAFAGEDLYTNEAIAAFDAEEAKHNGIDLNYLSLVLPAAALTDNTKNSMGAKLLNKDKIFDLEIPIPENIDQQIELSNKFNTQLTEIEKAREAVEMQLREVTNLANALIYESVNSHPTKEFKLGDVLDEVKKGIGDDWNKYPVYGATRSGIAMAKEPPGKNPQRYKPITPGTVFYNPMRIMIGSIAFAEDDVKDGITSPDYVVLKGKDEMVDSRWFYFWLRSPLGEQCINSLARGAVRERMLFNRLAEGPIQLPDFKIQQQISSSLESLKAMRAQLINQQKELSLLPQKILTQAFEEVSK